MNRRMLFLVALLTLAAGGADAHRRVRVHLGLAWGWWYPWGWGPVVVRAANPDLAVVDTDVSPEHARLFLDGQLIGTADDFDGNPDYLYLKPGRYLLEFSLPGYESEQVEIDAQPGRYFPLEFELRRQPGQKAAPWYDRPEGLPVARVFGPRKSHRDAPARPDPRLRPELQGPAPAPRVREGKAALRLVVEPPHAAVYLDGQFIGTGEELAQLVRGLAVEAGKHQVEVVAPGMTAVRQEVSLAAGEEREVRLRLSPGTGQNHSQDL